MVKINNTHNITREGIVRKNPIKFDFKPSVNMPNVELAEGNALGRIRHIEDFELVKKYWETREPVINMENVDMISYGKHKPSVRLYSKTWSGKFNKKYVNALKNENLSDMYLLNETFGYPMCVIKKDNYYYIIAGIMDNY